MPSDSATRDLERQHANHLRHSLDAGDVVVRVKGGREVVGQVESVAATDAFAIVGGWHIPLATVLNIHPATSQELAEAA